MKKIFTLFAAVMVSALSFAAVVEYTLTITPSDFTTKSYTDNNGEHTLTATSASPEATMEVKIITQNIMAGTWTNKETSVKTPYIQVKSSEVNFYNTTNLGKIKSIALAKADNADLNAKYIIGATENPTVSAADGAYFSIQPNGGTGRIGSITIVFEKSDEVVAVTGVELDKTALNLEVGEKATLTATVKPLDATNKEYAWSTTDDKVATIVDGVVTAIGVGAATITATTKDGSKTATCAVTVVAATKSEYALTALTDIKTGDDIIIVMKDSNNVLYALEYAAGQNATPKAIKVREVEGTLKEYSENTTFHLSYDAEKKGYVFDVTKEENTYVLYTTDNNTNVRVSKPGSTAQSAWVLDEGYLHTAGQYHKDATYEEDGKTIKTEAKDYYRYLGVYNATDFRTYDSTTGNIKKQTVLFYVKDNGGEPITPTAIENSEVEAKAVKIVRNGQVIIVREGVEYDLMGARL